MPQRITIVLDDEMVIKLRNLQAKKIKELNKSISFSSVVNEILEMGLKTKGK